MERFVFQNRFLIISPYKKAVIFMWKFLVCQQTELKSVEILGYRGQMYHVCNESHFGKHVQVVPRFPWKRCLRQQLENTEPTLGGLRVQFTRGHNQRPRHQMYHHLYQKQKNEDRDMQHRLSTPPLFGSSQRRR